MATDKQLAEIERTLNALRRMNDNRLCATCRKEDRFGHKNVCMKFRTFVCSDCKSAHQAFSHKCKSVTMSNWSREEVNMLKAPHGGNAANAAYVFAKLAQGSEAYPKNCPPDEVKAFVNLAYNELRWAGEQTAVESVQSTPLHGKAPASEDLFGDFETPPQVASVRSAPVPMTFDLLGDYECPPLAAQSHSASDASFDELSKHALLQGTNYFEAMESAPTTATTADLLAAMSFDTAAPTAQSTRDASNSMDELDAFGSFESAAPFESAAVSPASVIDDEPLGKSSGKRGKTDGGVADLFSKLMAVDLMAPSQPLQSAAAPTMAKAATPMAKMTTAAKTPTPFEMASVPMVTTRPALGHDFVDMSAMRAPPMRAPPMGASMQPGMRPPMHAGMFAGM